VKCEQEIKDIIIVGGGPAAITSAIYAARMKRCVWMLYEVLAGQASLTSNIENYTGFRMISGSDFTNTLQDHLDDYDLQPMKEKSWKSGKTTACSRSRRTATSTSRRRLSSLPEPGIGNWAYRGRWNSSATV
jgi:alkyl hydroperoxide reductase subunit AhpF